MLVRPLVRQLVRQLVSQLGLEKKVKSQRNLILFQEVEVSVKTTFWVIQDKYMLERS